jgi:hypothetical protein
VSVTIADGTLSATYDGAFANIDPAIPFDDKRYEASLTGVRTHGDHRTRTVHEAGDDGERLRRPGLASP